MPAKKTTQPIQLAGMVPSYTGLGLQGLQTMLKLAVVIIPFQCEPSMTETDQTFLSKCNSSTPFLAETMREQSF